MPLVRLKTYINLTSSLRASDCRQLLVSYVKPHRPVTSDTVARWIREVMSAANIDTAVFGAHSVRGASASLARPSVPLDEVLKAGDWSGLSAFHKHYHRETNLLPSAAIANSLMRSLSVS